MKVLPVRPVDMPLEKKKQKVADLENMLSAYRENPSLLLSDLKRMPPQRDNYTEGCFDPDADGYDLCADSPLNQAVQCYDFGRRWKSSTTNFLYYYKYLRLGDVINLMMNREKFMSIPGMGSAKHQSLKDGLMEHGWPMDKILPEPETKRRKK